MFEDSVYIVTGGGRGLGEATAIELGRHGATVVVNDLGVSLEGEDSDDEPARDTADRVREVGGEAMAHFGDVSELDYTETLVTETVDEFGRVDGVVNFAGILRDSISYKMTGEEFDSVVNVHLRGHFSMLRNVAAHWREEARDNDDELDSQRSFVSVTSRAALGSIGQINYSSAKAGVLGLTRSAAQELSRYNVRANALMPIGYTRMVESMPHEPFSEEDMPPETVAATAAFLLSDEAEGLNGLTVRAEGDQIGIISDPEFTRTGFRDDGWTTEAVAERFRSIAGEGDLGGD